MTCAELKDLVVAAALGCLDADERAAFEAHLREAEHDGCREALARANAVVGTPAAALPPIRPRPEVWKAIAARVQPRRRGLPPLVALAGWVAAAAAAGWLAVVGGRAGDAEKQVTATRQLYRVCSGELDAVRAEQKAQREAIALMELPGTQVVALAPQGTAAQRATAIWHRASGRAVVVGHGLVAQPGKDYELWVIRGEEKLPAGLLRAREDGSLTLAVDPGLLVRGVDAFAITLEPAGGSTSPRGPILLVGSV